MAQFLKLTSPDGQASWHNVDTVRYFETGVTSDGAIVYFIPEGSYEVLEKVEDIVRQLNSEKVLPPNGGGKRPDYVTV